MTFLIDQFIAQYSYWTPAWENGRSFKAFNSLITSSLFSHSLYPVMVSTLFFIVRLHCPLMITKTLCLVLFVSVGLVVIPFQFCSVSLHRECMFVIFWLTWLFLCCFLFVPDKESHLFIVFPADAVANCFFLHSFDVPISLVSMYVCVNFVSKFRDISLSFFSYSLYPVMVSTLFFVVRLHCPLMITKTFALYSSYWSVLS